MDHASNQRLLLLRRCLTVVNYVFVVMQRVLLTHDPVALSVERLVHGAHALEVPRPNDQLLLVFVLDKLVCEDMLEDVIDLLA